MIAELTIHIKSVFELRKLLKDGWQICHPPNEEVQTARAVSKQLALGMLPGVPDLILFSPKGRPHFIEFKRHSRSQSRTVPALGNSR